MTEKTKKAEEFSTIDDVLHHIQKNLHAPKNQHNKFGGYNYRSCEDILEAVKKILPEGATVKVGDDLELIGSRIYVKATATLKYKGEKESNTAYAREEETKKGMDAAQITGSASSYARKYALNGLFLIDDVKDPDSNETKEEEKKEEKKKEPPKEDPKRAAYAKMREQILDSHTLEVLSYVWTTLENGQAINGIKMSDLPAEGKNGLLDAYKKKMSTFSQAPLLGSSLTDDQIPY